MVREVFGEIDQCGSVGVGCVIEVCDCGIVGL
jgi:hypothetical protein